MGDKSWAWNQLLLPDIGMAASWVVPLLLGVIVAGFVLYRQNKTMSVILGIVTICASYFFLCWKLGRDITECSKTQPMCGEGSFLVDILYAGMCVVNILALMGCMFLFRKILARRKSNVQEENQMDVET